MSRFTQEVAYGVELLDTYGPQKWWEKINRATFRMISYDHCVLGQVFGDWDEALIELNHPDTQVSGFMVPFVEPSAYDELQEEWERVLDEKAALAS